MHRGKSNLKLHYFHALRKSQNSGKRSKNYWLILSFSILELRDSGKLLYWSYNMWVLETKENRIEFISQERSQCVPPTERKRTCTNKIIRLLFKSNIFYFHIIITITWYVNSRLLSTLKRCNIKVVQYEIISSLDSWEYIRYDAVIFAEARSSILSYLILRCIWKLSSTWKSVNLRLHLPPSSCPVQQQQWRYEIEKNKYVKRGTRFGQATTKMLILISCNCYFNIYFETRFH